MQLRWRTARRPTRLRSTRLIVVAVLAAALAVGVGAFVAAVPTATALQDVACQGFAFFDTSTDGAFDRDAGERPAPAVQVRITGSDDTVAELRTDATGGWAEPPGTTYPIRVEFTPPAGYAIAPAGEDAGTQRQFIADPSTCATSNAGSIGIAVPGDHCLSNVELITSCFVVAGTANHDDATAVLALNDETEDNGTGDGQRSSDWLSTDYTPLATAGEVGSVYGLAVGADRTVYAATFVKESTRLQSALNPDGNPTTIFAIRPGERPQVFVVIDPNAADPHRSRSDDPRATGPGAVYSTGLGDVQLSADGSTLWTINLGARELVSVDVATATVQQRTPLDGAALGVDDCAVTDEQPFGDLRPFGLGLDADDSLLIGVVCSAESTVADSDFPVDGPAPGNPAGDDNHLVGYVLDFDGTSFVQKLAWPLAGNRGRMQTNGQVSHDAAWHPWVSVYPFDAEFDAVAYSQPAITDLSLGDDGRLVIAIGDRWGHQTAPLSEMPAWDGSTRSVAETLAGGDLQYACATNVGWTIEGADACPGGQGEGEFFRDDRYGAHDETALGAVVHLPGNDEVVATHMDPVTGDATWRSGGLIWHRLNDGTARKGVRIYDGRNADPDGTFEKAAGVGGLAVRCSLAPVQIGSMVWHDQDADGVRDLTEPGIAGVTLALYRPGGEQLATTTTDGDGNFLFDSRSIDAHLDATIEYRVVVDRLNYEQGGVFHPSGDWRGLVGGSITGSAADNTAVVEDNPALVWSGLPTSVALAGSGRGTTTTGGMVDHMVGFGMVDSFDLSVSNSVTDLDVASGLVSFEVVVMNTGSLASGPFSVAATLPTRSVFVASSLAPESAIDAELTWDFDANEVLAPGENIAIAMQASLDEVRVDSYRHVAEVIPATPDDRPDNNSAVTIFGIGEIGGAIDPATAGVPVALLDSGGHEVAIAATDTTGRYAFSYLPPGDYQVQILEVAFAPGSVFEQATAVSGFDLVDADPQQVDVTTGTIQLDGRSPVGESTLSPSETLDEASNLTIDFSVESPREPSKYRSWKFLVPLAVLGTILLWVVARRIRRRKK